MHPELDVARIRTIKPEFWADEKLGPMLPLDRLVFLGLMSLADDAGRLLDSVKALDGALFPHTEDTCGPSLERLASASRIVRGRTQSGQRVIQIVNWEKHQRVDHPNLLAALPKIVVADEVTDLSRAPREPVANGARTPRASTNDQRPVPTTSTVAPAARNWLAPFIDLHREKAGEPAVGPMGKVLKKLRIELAKMVEYEIVDANEQSAVDRGMLVMWGRWLDAGKAEYGVHHFARTWRTWAGLSTKDAKNKQAVTEFLEGA